MNIKSIFCILPAFLVISAASAKIDIEIDASEMDQKGAVRILDPFQRPVEVNVPAGSSQTVSLEDWQARPCVYLQIGKGVPHWSPLHGNFHEFLVGKDQTVRAKIVMKDNGQGERIPVFQKN